MHDFMYKLGQRVRDKNEADLAGPITGRAEYNDMKEKQYLINDEEWVEESCIEIIEE